jgi:hypothetical protein
VFFFSVRAKSERETVSVFFSVRAKSVLRMNSNKRRQMADLRVFFFRQSEVRAKPERRQMADLRVFFFSQGEVSSSNEFEYKEADGRSAYFSEAEFRGGKSVIFSSKIETEIRLFFGRSKGQRYIFFITGGSPRMANAPPRTCLLKIALGSDGAI